MKLNTSKKEMTTGVLIEKIKKKQIILQPDFQRGYVYSDKDASELIESMLVGIPIPMIYLFKEGDKYLVVDGQQRLTTIYRFQNNLFSLSGLTETPEVNNFEYGDLNEHYQTLFDDYSFTVNIIESDDYETKYKIFERLNKCGKKLNAQEIRNCVFRGNLNNTIKDLAKDKEVLTSLYSLKCINKKDCNKRMRFEQDILTSLWMGELTSKGKFTKYFSSINPQINNFMKENMSMSENESQNIFKKYKKMFVDGYEIFGEMMHVNYTRYALINIMNSFDIRLLRKYKDEIVEMLKTVINSDDNYLKNVATRNCGHSYNIYNSHNILKEYIFDLLCKKGEFKNNRFFDKELKEKLYEKQEHKCAICNQEIFNINFAEIDHIIPYSKGGETNIENAQLTHRFCNRSKGNDTY